MSVGDLNFAYDTTCEVLEKDRDLFVESFCSFADDCVEGLNLYESGDIGSGIGRLGIFQYMAGIHIDMAAMANSLGKIEDRDMHMARAQDYKALSLGRTP
tara:strand:+ start:3912 stop:4211 length:300 start_codon:yes stop_codon:yes gene_type:complete